MDDCIFCKIVSGEIPAELVYEDDFVIAFRDVAPQAPVHVIIIPKQHIISVAELDSSNSHLAAKCLEAAAVIAKNENLDNGFRIIANSGYDGGQTVFHMHFHLCGGKALNRPCVW